MPIHLCKLLPPRPTFPGDMTPSEAELMQKHTAYWQDLADRGIALVVGPVLDPAGIWGIAIIDAKDADAAAALTSDDPVIAGGGGFRYDIHLVPQAILRTTHQPNPL
ncbi:YciI family protein [Microvirga terrae]|uniref:YciI family protein n=1 Tax=Microvirga terrae TaxID=2740529 RepID=A0ABY5RUL5_9HYPH|nr:MULTISPECIES: YciI family protein [Microvirga]UVF20016.1 YciI family protein [Microvirga terrae]